MHAVHIGQDVIHIVDAPAECAVSEIDDEFGPTFSRSTHATNSSCGTIPARVP